MTKPEEASRVCWKRDSTPLSWML